jgi:flagellar hook protein FlgE
MGFEQALSGLQAASAALDNIGNNIANSQTVGFKDATTQFADVYASTLYGSAANQIGIGVDVAAVTSQFTQGNITTTGNPLDLAINGQGFFQVQSNGVTSYTRDGEFSLNSTGNIVNSAGQELLGYPAAANGTISTGVAQPLVLSSAATAPQATTTASLSLNLDSSDTPITVAFNANNSDTYNSSTSMTVYDSLGNPHTLTTYYVMSAANTWNVYASVDGNVLNAGNPIPPGLTFNDNGLLASGASANMSLTIPVTTGATSPMTMSLQFPYTSTTQYGSAFAPSANTQNGYSAGQLASFSVGANGIITGQYTNGETYQLGQVALANFTNPQGLTATSGNLYQQSQASGQPIVGAPGAGSLGVLQSGAVENSTVDITSQLVAMITAQQAYQANAETVKTQDQVDQTLMTLR